MRGLIIAIALVALLAVGYFVYTQNKSSKKTSSQSTSQDNSNSNQASDNTTAQSSVTITYSDSGFSPETVTVTVGGSVTIKNGSSSTVQFDSNPHPIHTDNDELNVGAIAAGGSKTITVTKAGSWGYHNHLDSSQGGKIVVN